MRITSLQQLYCVNLVCVCKLSLLIGVRCVNYLFVMASGSFYRRGMSMTSHLSGGNEQFGLAADGGNSSNSGSMYEFPSASGQFHEATNQKLDRVVSLLLEQRTVSNNLQMETNELRKQVASLRTEVSSIKEQVDQQTPSSSGGRQKIPAQLSVSWGEAKWWGKIGWGEQWQ